MTTPVAVAVAAALWLGALWDGPPVAAVPALALLGIAAPLASRRRTSATALVLVALLLLGGALAGGRGRLRDASPLAAMAERSAVAAFSGRIVAEARVTGFGRWTIVRLSRVGPTALAARAMLHLRPGDPTDVGQSIAGRVRVTGLPDGGFGAHLRTLGVAAVLRPVSALRTRPAPALLRSTTIVRRRADAAFARALPPSRAALLSGLVLGARKESGAASLPMDALRDVGLSHLVVVSGRHVAVLLAGLLAVAAICRVGHKGAHGLALAAVWWFVVLTRWQPSVLRAAVMASLVLIAALRGRPRDSVHTLAVTASLLLLCDPLLARQAGFALSVLATGGVLVALGRRDGNPPRPLRDAVRATVGAQIATAPIILSMVGEVPLAALPANLVGAPAAMVAQSMGIVAAALAASGLPGAVLVARTATVPLAVLEWAASAFAAAPSLSARGLLIAVAVAVGAVAVRRMPQSSRGRRAVAWSAVVVSTTVVASGLLPNRAPQELRLTAIDVGQGDALLIEAPDDGDGARMLVDGGPESDAIDGVLRSRRIRALDVVVLTHGDHDHAGGLRRVLRRRRVGTLLVPAGDPAMRDGSASARAAVAAARASGVPVVAAHAGQRFVLGAARVEVLAPPARRPTGVGRNARSIVMRIDGAHGSILLTGDADATSQLRLLARPDLLRADVLQVPHHGGDTNAEGFVDAARAAVAVASVGAGNRYGHPHPDTVADVAPVPLWRTDRDGTITVELTGVGPIVTASRPRGG